MLGWLVQAQIEQWIEFSTHEIDAPLMSWVLPVWGYLPYDKKVRRAAVRLFSISPAQSERCPTLMMPGSGLRYITRETQCHLWHVPHASKYCSKHRRCCAAPLVASQRCTKLPAAC